MLKQTLFLVFLSLIGSACMDAQVNQRIDYIENFKEIAIREMERTGIPASIKLGQGILESNAGQSELARKAKNHFGIKCGSGWNGKKYFYEDDDYNDAGELIRSCFRIFDNAEASYIAHSEFLRDPKKAWRYGFLFRLDPGDYKAWARGLRRAGYASSPTYADKLIRIIETYELHKYDLVDVAAIEAPEVVLGNIVLNNDVKLIYSRANETPGDIAVRTGTSLRRILKYNEGLTSESQKLEKYTRVYIQRKRNNYRGKKTWHYVQPGESMYDISQLYGLKLKKLYKKNNMKPPQQAAVDERVRIRGKSKTERPLLASELQSPREMPPPSQNVKPDEDHEITTDIEEVPVPPREEEIEDEEMEEIENEEEEMENEEEEEMEEGEVENEEEEEVPPLPVNNPARAKELKEMVESLNLPIKNLDIKVVNEEATIYGQVPSELDRQKITQAIGNAPGIKVIDDRIDVVPPSNEIKTHTVQKGDTLYNISRRYNTTVDELRRLNNLPDNTINIGQVLKVKE
jgi:LysM repeat protein